MADNGFRVVIDNAALARVTRGPQGPVFRRMVSDAELVKTRARELVGVHQPADAYDAAHRKRRPGTLRDSIVKRVRQVAGRPVIEVGTEDPIALIHHEGTVPHIIRARNAPNLVFYSRKAGRVIVTKSVSHPGTKPNRFLLKALDALRGRYRGSGTPAPRITSARTRGGRSGR